MLIFRALFVLPMLALAVPATAETVAGPPTVIDGDTLHVGDEKLRLFGIDAPERDQACTAGTRAWACGAWAARELAAKAGDWVECRGDTRDRYGRLLATCDASGGDLGAAMVAAGAATAYTRYSDAYADIEAFARAKEAGIWGGGMLAPEDHRRTDPQPAPEGGCAIKGNISANGRIYHRPGQADYDATRINPARGEQWFCTPAEAEAAGFRAARR
jgi:endonuclease YncB( thermonuclease family)